MTFVPRLSPLLRQLTLLTLRQLTLRNTVAAVKYSFIFHFFSTHVGWHALTDGPSMVPTINVRGVRVIIDKTFSRGRGIKVGDVVDIQHPIVLGAGAIKRVMGMPGDFVVKDEGEGKGKRMIQVPDGHCWLLGDNLPDSRDSRVYGPVPLALIKGKVIARLWPWSDIGWIENNLQRPEEP